MAQAGVGVDMLEIGRVERALRRRPSFAERVFTEDERHYCERKARPAQHYAACLAARGAVVRALGIAPGDGVGRWDVSVTHGVAGRPEVVLSGRADQVARRRGVREVALSLSFTHEVAVANAVAMTDEVRPQTEEAPDPREELRASFRAARSVIDELERIQQDSSGSPSGAGQARE